MTPSSLSPDAEEYRMVRLWGGGRMRSSGERFLAIAVREGDIDGGELTSHAFTCCVTVQKERQERAATMCVGSMIIFGVGRPRVQLLARVRHFHLTTDTDR
jgi:hypothetical protein